jgi:hypothetical protein
VLWVLAIATRTDTVGTTALLLAPRSATVLDPSPLVVSAERAAHNLCNRGHALYGNVLGRVQRPSVDELSLQAL